jgi:hypothetical protein
MMGKMSIAMAIAVAILWLPKPLPQGLKKCLGEEGQEFSVRSQDGFVDGTLERIIHNQTCFVADGKDWWSL